MKPAGHNSEKRKLSKGTGLAKNSKMQEVVENHDRPRNGSIKKVNIKIKLSHF